MTKINQAVDIIATLTDKEKLVLEYLCNELEDWRVSEPSYSCVGGTDVSKHFGWNKKITSGLCSSLVQKGLLYVSDEFKDTLFINWDKINLGTFLNFKSETPKTIVKNTTKEIKKQTKPYQIYGLHGKNIEIDQFKKGDIVNFILKGKKVSGEFVHFHVNNHSPNGYAVIKYKSNIYERVLSKISLKNLKNK